MLVLKCKMCGGDLHISDNSSVVECEYCGSQQTLPSLDSEKIVAMFDRANYYRTINEFDKAAGIYENILTEVSGEAEAHWGLCLCRYGIEYVEDPQTKKRIPTCHRTHFASILEDKDFLQAVDNADLLAKDVYRQEAEYINQVQKGILEISSKEESFDIFICYKETDEFGDRTIDSVIAQEIYNELIENGYKVFFSRITLEDKIGTAYEPYIFSALTSAKVMLVIGTKSDHFNSVWVKNEWSRYLSLITQGQRKVIIPCYRDISAYDMPKEFAHLQAQDIAKIGWKQDLIRGIGKILSPASKIMVKRETDFLKELSLDKGLYIGDAIAGKPHGNGKCQYENGIVYEGQWQFGKWNGNGVCSYPSGERYEGEFVDGKRNGQGIYYYPDGKTWFGEWKDEKEWNGSGYIRYEIGAYEGSIVEGEWNGEAHYYYDDGECYEGQYVNGKRHGHGTVTYSNGKQWSGEWKDDEKWNGSGYAKYDLGYYEGPLLNGKWNGQGLYQYDDGRCYKGEFHDGKRNGQGIYYYPNGKKWSGEWKDHIECNGTGYIKLENGYYEGDLSEGKFSGHGRRVYDDKSYYEGEFSSATYDGNGTYFYSNGKSLTGDKWSGIWSKGKMDNGTGTIVFPNGKYVGECKSGKRDGSGTFTWYAGVITIDEISNEKQRWNDTPTLKGEWKNGEIWEGYGSKYYSDGRYTGYWKNGKRNGQGTYSWTQRGAQSWTGEWKDDMPWTGDGYWRCKEFFEAHYTLKNGRKNQGCYIATCVYGTYNCPQVWVLRRFRDNFLLKYGYGRIFVKLYYFVSPKLVKWFGSSDWFKKLFEKPLNKIVSTLENNGISNTPYDDK